ncbi:hypothetical protein CWI39_1002p0020 [Hamiltosporidium magnivora]|uniref:Uncharacterized protein n=1 Tax=Hamiltosporidium magnivora TaxID=148818 RepID=A0A4Q9L903_9MICR|nr:hypothetical protein CWI39_1002p0020 [Hamiltosporidium magnivora]
MGCILRFNLTNTLNEFKLYEVNCLFIISFGQNKLALYLFNLSKKYFFIFASKYICDKLQPFERLCNKELLNCTQNNLQIKYVFDKIFLILEYFMISIDSLGDFSDGYKLLEFILNFLEKNLHTWAYESLINFFKNTISEFFHLMKILNNLEIFSRILDLIAQLDLNSVNPLKDVFYDLKYIDFFIDAQSKHESIFLFVSNELNSYKPLERVFDFKSSEDKRISFYRIIASNINLNIDMNKKFAYNKEILFSFIEIYDSFEDEKIFSHLICLIRLSEYSGLFTKKEIYKNFGFKNVLDFLSKDRRNIFSSQSILIEYAYLYLYCLLEDEVYILCSILYIKNYYVEVSESILKYFDLKLIYKDDFRSPENRLLKKEEIYLKKDIVYDLLIILQSSKSFQQTIITLKFLTESFYIFPLILNLIDLKILLDLFYKNTTYETEDDNFSIEKQQEWYINFKYGFLFTVMFYRATNEIVFKLIDDICTKLSDYDNIEFFSMISFIHKVFLSEICCCKYSLNSNEEKVNLIDSNCEKNFLERRSQIFGRFLKKGLLDILVTAYEKFDLSQSCILKIIGLITIIIDTREFILNNTCFVTKIFRIKSSMEHIVFIPRFLEKSNFTEIHMQKNGSVPILKSKKNIFKQIDYTKYLRLDFGCLKGKHSNSKILHDFVFNDKNLHIKEFNNDLEDLDSFKLLSKLFCVNLHGKMFDTTIKKIYPENSSTVRDEYDASDLENIHFNFLGTYLQDISCEDGFKTHKLSNIGKEERFKFSDFLTEEKLSNIFLRLLIFFKGRKEACILNNIKSIIIVCSNHKLLGSFNYFLIKNIETYEKVQNDQIISYRLEILRLIVIDYQFIIRFKTDSLSFNVFIFVLIDITNEYFLKFDRKTHLRSLISIFLSENISNENSIVEFLLLNMNQINEKHLSLGFYFGLKTILFFVEMMKDKICKIFLPFDNDKENNLDFFVFKEFEMFLEKFHDFKFELTVDFLED